MNPRMNATSAKLAAILVAGMMLRLALLGFVDNPGLHDPVHYYNLGARLADGKGFTINYVWHYNILPSAVTHPIDHWMPLAGVAASLGMALFGQSPHAALFVFILAGSLLPALVFIVAKQLALSDTSALLSAAFAACLPDLLLASLRTDTTILNACALCLSALLFSHGLRNGLRHGLRNEQRLSIALCGALTGLAYLTRNDSLLLLPVFICVLVLRALWRRERTSPREAVSFVLTLAFTLIASFLLTVSPWLLRNWQTLDLLGTPETSRMFFMVEHQDHYAYGMPITLESMLQRQSLAELLAKRTFELLAALKQIIVSVTLPLLVGLVGGAGLLFRRRDPERLVPVWTALIWLLGILLFYPILLPLKSQAGSFEKAFLSSLPLLLPLAALALMHFLRRPLLRWSAVGALLLWLSLSCYHLLREETAKADLYYDSIAILLDSLEDLPDQTGDDRLRVMAQDPYVFSYFGYEAVMMPFATRAHTLELARRYEIDYMMMPPGRPPLDPLYLSQEKDERFVLVAHLPEAGAKPFELYRFVHD